MIAVALLLAAAQGADGASPGFDVAAPRPALAQPPRDTPLDPVVAALVIARLVDLHLLDRAEDGSDATKVAAAVRQYQQAVGFRATGLLDRATLAAILP